MTKLPKQFRFAVLLVDHRNHGQWSHKPAVMFLIEHIHDLLHLGLYACFFFILTLHWGFPLHLMRELFLAFHNTKNRIQQYMAYRRIVKILGSSYLFACFSCFNLIPTHSARINDIAPFFLFFFNSFVH